MMITTDTCQRLKRTGAGAVLALLAALSLASTGSAADYLIGEGDKLVISVWGEKELSGPVVVRPDGKISMPAVGEVAAARRSVKELQETITERLQKMVKKAIVTVMVGEISNNKAYVFGGGVKNAVVTLTQRTTLLQLMCQIEEVKKADLRKAYLLRNDEKIKEDFFKLYMLGDTAEDVVIEPNDLIYLPVNLIKNVYVMGAVSTPKYVEYREGLTVMDAILEAGGFTKYADQNNTVIYRKIGARHITIPVKMKKLINDGDITQNQRLDPGDYIVVKEGIF